MNSASRTTNVHQSARCTRCSTATGWVSCAARMAFRDGTVFKLTSIFFLIANFFCLSPFLRSVHDEKSGVAPLARLHDARYARFRVHMTPNEHLSFSALHFLSEEGMSERIVSASLLLSRYIIAFVPISQEPFSANYLFLYTFFVLICPHTHAHLQGFSLSLVLSFWFSLLPIHSFPLHHFFFF